ncbi:hypothetical protein QQZ08_010964 [Neonectria magnoliae]|uniref:Glucose-methanol-choline oxidoreductase N-terminal domain-containing protein n=1 Tax=Neonectria magnoliae TaxID=2732573 RepID=A0ABR1HDI4_9HYPO
MLSVKCSVVAALIALQTALASRYPRPRAGQLRTEYDYVVIGAGASGLTVANRLTEDLAATVLVIEAGDFDAKEDYVTIPGLAGGAVGTKYDWNLTYIASESPNWRNVSLPQGKVVGGSTKLNRMVFDRGSKSDYDRWAALGIQGWDWDTLLPYFKKNERFTPPNDSTTEEYGVTFDPAAHGASGYMHSTYSPLFWPTTKNIVEAMKELDVSIAKDQANGGALGGYFCPHNQDPVSVTRSSAREAYYESAAKRSNLHIITGRQVTQVLIKNEGDSVRAIGVEFAKSKNDAPETVRAKREVILAAGATHTPQILQVSGIGDSSLLSTINVTTIVDLPGVGQNFHDHVLLTVVNTINAPIVSSNLTSNATFAAQARAHGKIHSQAVAQDGTAFLPSGIPAEVANGYRKQQKILNDRLLSTKSAVLEIIWSDGAMLLGLQHPYSRGSIKAVSASIFDAAIVDVGFLRNPLDIAILVEGVNFTRKITATSAIKTLEPFEVVPGADAKSDEDLEEFIRSNAATFYHPAGSCKIGKRTEGGVVDEKLRVYGVDGLRVVDASVIPLLPAAHTMTTVYAVAERLRTSSRAHSWGLRKQYNHRGSGTSAGCHGQDEGPC